MRGAPTRGPISGRPGPRRATGGLPEHEPALYLAAVVLLLFMEAFMLLMLVTSAVRPPTAPDPAAMPATGGPSA